MNKFEEYMKNNEENLSKYVHFNVKLIATKMISEMSRKLDVYTTPHEQEDFFSLMISLHGRMFNEIIYALSGFSENFNLKFYEIISPLTLKLLFSLMKEEKIDLNEIKDTQLSVNSQEFKDFYEKNIEEITSFKEALPK